MALNDAVPSSATDVFKRNIEDTDRLLNTTDDVVNRVGTTLESFPNATGRVSDAADAAQIAIQADVDNVDASRISAQSAITSDSDSVEASRIAAELEMANDVSQVNDSEIAAQASIQSDVDSVDATRILAEQTIQDDVDAAKAAAIANYQQWNSRGNWAPATAYLVGDIWQNTATSTWYLVLNDYTSGATVNDDIAGPNVTVLQGAGIQSFEGLSEAITKITANPELFSDNSSVSISSNKTKAECVSAGVDFPDGNGGDYVITTGETLVDGRVIAAGTKQLKLITQKLNLPIENITALRLFEPTIDGQECELSGHTVKGIGGGEFYAILNDVGGVDNNGTKFMATGGHSWNRSNVSNLSAEMFGLTNASSPSENLAAINSCISEQLELGGGRPTIGTGEFEVDGTIVARRKVVLVGNGDLPTVIKLSDASNVDIIKSENFDSLTGSNDTTTNPFCPFSFGFENIQVNGNKANQTSGGGCRFYGPRLILDKFMVYNCKEDGIYSEYSDQIGSSTPEGQEEASIGSVISRDNDGNGWLFRGPHNSVIDNYIGANNGDWGFRNEILPGSYDGNITLINHIHTYKNGLITGQNNESYFGAVTSINYLIVDGGYCEIASGDCQISMVKLIFGGQTNHGIILSGDHNNIGMINGAMLSGTSGYDLLRITGDNNWIGRARLNGSSNNHDGAVILGSGNTIDSLNSRECVRGLAVTGGLNTVSGKLLLCTDSFSYSTPTGTHPGKNKINLDIYQTSGSYVIGDRPVDQLDRFEISATGKGNLYTSAVLQSGTVPLDTTAVQPLSIPHGLLYTPTRQSVSLTRITSSPTDTSFEPGDLRVVSTDATNINIELVMQTSAAAGSLGRVGVKVRI